MPRMLLFPKSGHRTAAVIGKAGAITAEAKAHGRQGKERGYTNSRTHRQEPVLGLDPDGAVVYEYVSTRDFITLTESTKQRTRCRTVKARHDLLLMRLLKERLADGG